MVRTACRPLFTTDRRVEGQELMATEWRWSGRTQQGQSDGRRPLESGDWASDGRRESSGKSGARQLWKKLQTFMGNCSCFVVQTALKLEVGRSFYNSDEKIWRTCLSHGPANDRGNSPAPGVWLRRRRRRQSAVAAPLNWDCSPGTRSLRSDQGSPDGGARRLESSVTSAAGAGHGSDAADAHGRGVLHQVATLWSRYCSLDLVVTVIPGPPVPGPTWSSVSWSRSDRRRRGLAPATGGGVSLDLGGVPCRALQWAR